MKLNKNSDCNFKLSNLPDDIEYVNEGKVRGIIAREPYVVNKDFLSLTIVVGDKREAFDENKILYHFPTFILSGKNVEKKFSSILKRGTLVDITYKLETRLRESIEGNTKRFTSYEDKVIISLEIIKFLSEDNLPQIMK